MSDHDFDNFWFGVVEDRDDPMKLGRCRVRIVGYHSEDKGLVPTADLPWAFPISPITEASIDGLGRSPTGLVCGTWVVGFFRDGESAQQPVMLGTAGGMQTALAEPRIGFNDPNGKYPAQKDVPGTSSLAAPREPEHPYLKVRKDDRKIDVPTASDTKWSEPEYTHKSVYPYNKTNETESGHILEVDDTKDNERLHFRHKSGSFVEFTPVSTFFKSKGTNYTIIGQNDYVSISGSSYCTIEKDSELLVNDNLRIRNKNGSLYISTDSGSIHVQSAKDVNLTVKGNVNQTVDGKYSLTCKGNVNITSDGDVNIQGSSINLNS